MRAPDSFNFPNITFVDLKDGIIDVCLSYTSLILEKLGVFDILNYFVLPFLLGFVFFTGGGLNYEILLSMLFVKILSSFKEYQPWLNRNYYIQQEKIQMKKKILVGAVEAFLMDCYFWRNKDLYYGVDRFSRYSAWLKIQENKRHKHGLNTIVPWKIKKLIDDYKYVISQIWMIWNNARYDLFWLALSVLSFDLKEIKFLFGKSIKNVSNLFKIIRLLYAGENDYFKRLPLAWQSLYCHRNQ